jgi:ribose 5-phosphate isomerase A
VTLDQAARKQQAAEYAAELVQPGMRVGLGTGSTASYATRRIADRLAAGELPGVTAFATSRATDEEARRLGIPMIDDELPVDLDLTIDGADEVDPHLDLIKGGGGALLREKIVAQASTRVVIVVDDSKPSRQLGTSWPVPVEVLEFAWRSQARYLESLGGSWTMRRTAEGDRFTTDSGNLILDCAFGPIPDAAALGDGLSRRAGIVEHGLFLGLATDLIVAGQSGIQHTRRA